MEGLALESYAVDLSGNVEEGTGVGEFLCIADRGLVEVHGGQVEVVQPTRTGGEEQGQEGRHKRRGSSERVGVHAATAVEGGGDGIEVASLFARVQFPGDGSSGEDEHVDSKLAGGLSALESDGGVVSALADDALSVVVVNGNGHREKLRRAWRDGRGCGGSPGWRRGWGCGRVADRVDEDLNVGEVCPLSNEIGCLDGGVAHGVDEEVAVSSLG
mmetsp:Transcript_6827/g.10249  ORF Transcript_6827/g.10249 Transcript_6827/m.10249 type:complete len:215 (+) Transcript_6827:271-915(+)